MNIVPQNRNITIRPTSVLCVSHARLRASVLITKVRCILFRSRRRHFIRELHVRCLQIQYGNCALGQSNCLFRFRQQIAGVFAFDKQLTNRVLSTLLHRPYCHKLIPDQSQRICKHLHPTFLFQKSKGENTGFLNLLPSIIIFAVRDPVMFR